MSGTEPTLILRAESDSYYMSDDLTHRLRIWKAPTPHRDGEPWMLTCACGMIHGSPTWRGTLGRGVRHLKATA